MHRLHGHDCQSLLGLFCPLIGAEQLLARSTQDIITAQRLAAARHLVPGPSPPRLAPSRLRLRHIRLTATAPFPSPPGRGFAGAAMPPGDAGDGWATPAGRRAERQTAGTADSRDVRKMEIFIQKKGKMEREAPRTADIG